MVGGSIRRGAPSAAWDRDGAGETHHGRSRQTECPAPLSLHRPQRAVLRHAWMDIDGTYFLSRSKDRNHDLRAMTAAQFRQLARSFPGVIESSHMSHPDFRVGGKIFATLGYPDKNYGVVVVSPPDQAKLVRKHPEAFSPAKGDWGKRGCTPVLLAAVDKITMESALKSAWRNKAPK